MEITSLWLAFIVSLLVVSLTNWIYWWRNPKCKGKLPPGSMGLPLVGETLHFFITSNSIDIHPFIKERMERYGPLFKTSVAGRPMVVSLDPDFNYYLLQQEEKLVELYYMDAFEKLVHKDEMMIQGGYIHKYLRRTVLSRFGLEALKDKQLPLLELALNHGFHEWSKQPEVEVKTATASMLCDFTSKILFSYEPEKSEENLGEFMCNLLKGLMKFPLNIPGTAFHKCMKKQQRAIKMIRKLLEERLKFRPQACEGDLLNQLVDDIGKEEFLTKEFATLLMFGLLLASVETISTTIAVGIKYLMENPSEFQKLTEEQEEILKSREEGSNHGLSWEEYKSMTYTRYIINETLRLTSVAPGILRRVVTDIKVDGYTIPKGWILMVIPAALQLNPNTYEDPLTFNPSRWKNTGSISIAKNFIPFGGGNRTCAGAEYSKLLMAIFFHVWATKYKFTKIKGGNLARTPILEFKNGFYIKVSEKHA